jgi:cytochrome c peroxidase
MIACFLLSTKGFLSFQKPKHFPEPVYDFKNNPLHKPIIELGRQLFYEPALSKDTTISCASCHQSFTGFTHIDHKLSHGIRNQMGTRNAPVLFNLAWSNFFMADGAINRLDSFSITPIQHPKEMDERLDFVVRKLQQTERYKKMFFNAYQDSTVTGKKIMQSLSQFVLTLVSADSKYDKVKKGETTFNEWEQKGYRIFQKKCNVCHTEPLFTNGGFENNGLEKDTTLNDYGRYQVTKNGKDSFYFKVPTLRNIEVSSPYMHDGRFGNLPMVLFHYTNSVMPYDNLSKPLKQRIVLEEEEKNCLIAFLKTLTDEAFLMNPKFQYRGN